MGRGPPAAKATPGKPLTHPQRLPTNSENQITAIGSATVGYDANGNVITDDHGDTLVYDGWNRLVAVKNSSGSLIVGYTYDGLGRMTSQTNGIITIDFYYAGQQIIEERTGVTTATGSSTGSSGSVTEEFVYSPDYVNDVLLRDSYSGGSFSSRVYFTHDANYDVTSVISSGGSVDERMTYDAYGNVTFLTSSWTTTSDTFGVENLWQGGWRDATTGDYHFQNRWYSPSMQWLSWDPIDYPDGPSAYLPEGDGPINSTDPSGLWHWDPNNFGFIVIDGKNRNVVGQLAQAIYGRQSAYASLWAGDPTKVPDGTEWNVSGYILPYLNAVGQLAQDTTHAVNVIGSMVVNGCICPSRLPPDITSKLGVLKLGLVLTGQAGRVISASGISLPTQAGNLLTTGAGLISAFQGISAFKNGDIGGGISDEAQAAGALLTVLTSSAALGPEVGAAFALASIAKWGIESLGNEVYANEKAVERLQNCKLDRQLLDALMKKIPTDEGAVNGAWPMYQRIANLIGH